MWTHELSPFIALARNRLPTSCETLILKKKRVSVNLVTVDFCVYTFAHERFFLRNDDEVQSEHVRPNEPLANLRAKNVKVIDKSAFVTPATPATLGVEMARIASPATSVEKIIPQRKRQWVGDKGKEKADSRPSNI